MLCKVFYLLFQLLDINSQSLQYWFIKQLACEKSRPSSLPARVAFRETPLEPGAKKDGCFRRLSNNAIKLNNGLLRWCVNEAFYHIRNVIRQVRESGARRTPLKMRNEARPCQLANI